MLLKTKNGAIDILTIAENVLKDGRPRKPIGKARPVEQHGKHSLIGALRYAKKLLGATQAQYHAALDALELHAWLETPPARRWGAKSIFAGVEQYDEVELDTRQVIRTIGKAKKQLAQ